MHWYDYTVMVHFTSGWCCDGDCVLILFFTQKLAVALGPVTVLIDCMLMMVMVVIVCIE